MILRGLDAIAAPAVWGAGLLLKQVRRAGLRKLPICKAALANIGVLPVRDHYYEPQIRFGNADYSIVERDLPGVSWNEHAQLQLLTKLQYANELQGLPFKKSSDLEFHLDNNQFGPGDAEVWYQMVRLFKPRRIYEVGSGNSTLMAIRALRETMKVDPAYRCRHVCIEPYEMPWLEKSGVEVVRSRIEDVPQSFFLDLEDGDILFIDSSHVIRPYGDVLFEYLQVLPQLQRGVVVHVHDIFSPRNYPRSWIVDDIRLWNEQYLLEAFLTHNDHWEILFASNYLFSRHFDLFRIAAPYASREREPGSFYMRRK